MVKQKSFTEILLLIICCIFIFFGTMNLIIPKIIVRYIFIKIVNNIPEIIQKYLHSNSLLILHIKKPIIKNMKFQVNIINNTESIAFIQQNKI